MCRFFVGKIGGMPGPGRKSETCGRFLSEARVDVAVARLAARQHAVISLDQLRELGLTARTVQKRTENGRLHRIHRGVYSLVPRKLLTRNGRYMAAVLACGPGTLLSHRCAAALHGLLPTGAGKIEVTVPGRGMRRHDGIAAHRSTTLTPADATTVENIPCTSVARTLFDLADVTDRRDLPAPEVNKWLDLGDGEPMIKPDFMWRSHRLIVEVDSRRWHMTRARFESDRRRDQRTSVAGWRVLRTTHRQIEDRPAELHDAVARLIRRSRVSFGP